jgi:hypothetical protein
MSPSVPLNGPSVFDPVEFSIEDAVLNSWVEDAGIYLQLDISEPPPGDPNDGGD